mmetsp:Transcript_36927/g.81035  ORF Transcript_36927/g.81035 Transcript_36927/m.81035 type:complete len:348 (+) Transcript_36927:83-1126(+)
MVQKRSKQLSDSGVESSSSKANSEWTGDDNPPRVLAETSSENEVLPLPPEGFCQFAQNCAFAHSPMELQGVPELRKTRLCKAFRAGVCKDPKCTFAHGEEELRSTDMFYKRALCSWYDKGRCRNGSQCRFAHGLADLRMNQEGSTSSQSEASASVQDARGSSDDACEAQPMAKRQGRRHNQVHTSDGGDTPIRVDGNAGKAKPDSLLLQDPMFVKMSSCTQWAPENTNEVRVPARDAIPQGSTDMRTPMAASQVDIQLLSRAIAMLSSQMKAIETQLRNEQRSCSTATEEDVAMWGHLKTLAAMSANSTCPRTGGEYFLPVMRNSTTSLKGVWPPESTAGRANPCLL